MYRSNWVPAAARREEEKSTCCCRVLVRGKFVAASSSTRIEISLAWCYPWSGELLLRTQIEENQSSREINFWWKRFPSYSATSTHACLIYVYSIMRQLFLYSKFYPFPSRSMQSYLLISVHLMSSELVDIHIPLYMKNPRLRPLPFPTRTAVASPMAKEATICNSPSPSPCAR